MRYNIRDGRACKRRAQLSNRRFTNMDADFDIVFIGHISKDIIIAPGQHETGTGGAVWYGAFAALRAGARVAAVIRCAATDFPLLEPLRAAGAAVFPIAATETTSIENRYHDQTRERRTCSSRGFAGQYAVSELPDISARIWHLSGLVRGEYDLDLMRHLRQRGELSGDAQGFVRVVRPDKAMEFEDWPEKREALSLFSYFKTDAAEAEILTGETDVRAAAAQLAAWGAREVLLTHPGGALVHANGEFHNTPFTARNLSGRTGRGDTTMAAYLTRRLTHTPVQAGRFAAALVSIKMETPGPFAGALDDVLSRMD